MLFSTLAGGEKDWGCCSAGLGTMLVFSEPGILEADDIGPGAEEPRAGRSCRLSMSVAWGATIRVRAKIAMSRCMVMDKLKAPLKNKYRAKPEQGVASCNSGIWDLVVNIGKCRLVGS